MKRSLYLYIISQLLFCHLFGKNLQLYDLRCESRVNPLGITATQPHFSWKIQSVMRNTEQIAYLVLVSEDSIALLKNVGEIWNTGKLKSNNSIQIDYKGRKLKAATRYFWKVKIWDNHGQNSDWSTIATFQTGLFNLEDWKGAKWIGLQELADSLKIIPAPSSVNKGKKIPENEIMPMFRKEFSVKKEIKNAFIFIAGLGHFELSMNGKKIGDHFLDPGWTNYEKESIYQTFDVTSQLNMGQNSIGVLLGNGFYFTPSKRFKKLKVVYGFPKMICSLVVQYKDGSTERLNSDEHWSVDKSPVIFSSIYGGEDYDANLEQVGWDKPHFLRNWKNAIVVSGPKVLSSNTQEPVKVMKTFKPVKQITIKNVIVYDFGQNASGIVKINVKGHKGDTIQIIPAELLNEKSEANQKATGSPYYFTYILKGGGDEIWQPRFSYYGFRYAQVEMIPKQNGNSPKLNSIEMLQIRNAANSCGSFSCSDTLFNQTNKLIQWAIKSNMVSLFTDCPHREKLGWLEQEHLMGNSIQYNFDIASFIPKILKDMRLAQTDSGLIPEIAPEFVQFSEPFRDSPEWGSSSILVPWYAYNWYGDIRFLEENYSMMQRYIQYLENKSNNGILMQGLSDWYDIGLEKSGFSQLTPQGLTATAIYYYDLLVMSKIAKLLKKENDIKIYNSLAEKVKKSFNEKFYNPTAAQYGTGSQTSNAMAIYMQLVDSSNKQKVINNIVDSLEKNDYRLTAGDIGFRYLLLVLAEAGRSDVIYKMNNRSDVPGYGYQLSHGATSLTESWQAYSSVSNNHLMLGHLMEWFYQNVGGIKQSIGSVGYKNIDIDPDFVDSISYANTSYNSSYGTIVCNWKREKDDIVLDVVIPSNAKANIYFPKKNFVQLTERQQNINSSNLKKNEKRVMCTIGSGNYQFRAKYKIK
ncbi:family 78 glycoside hydrolase catalytic domain [Rhizosphaericola mali]|uniref:alpha-L-rhamnosidase n=1 Tax=Rhizosphaericola mali TaxID=2545455 RepID=A0A5P2FYJ5_9BACT|nr:family 78 glycoside hydrolase catalytic domain [Rhizosphaericola mali]QES88614.1 Bacterial alpha-L-rhamnosidase [Rhizosphaericola mali]